MKTSTRRCIVGIVATLILAGCMLVMPLYFLFEHTEQEEGRMAETTTTTTESKTFKSSTENKMAVNQTDVFTVVPLPHESSSSLIDLLKTSTETGIVYMTANSEDNSESLTSTEGKPTSTSDRTKTMTDDLWLRRLITTTEIPGGNSPNTAESTVMVTN